MLLITDIYGEIHTREDRDRIESELLKKHKSVKYDFILTEEVGDNIALTNKDKLIGINNHLWGISPRSYELGIKLNLPVIGIDTWDDKVYQENLPGQFLQRETRMVKVISEYSRKGNCVVLVGDSHLRTIATKELGGVSLLHKAFGNTPGFTIHRSPYREIE